MTTNKSSGSWSKFTNLFRGQNNGNNGGGNNGGGNNGGGNNGNGTANDGGNGGGNHRDLRDNPYFEENKASLFEAHLFSEILLTMGLSTEMANERIGKAAWLHFAANNPGVHVPYQQYRETVWGHLTSMTGEIIRNPDELFRIWPMLMAHTKKIGQVILYDYTPLTREEVALQADWLDKANIDLNQVFETIAHYHERMTAP